MSGNYLIASISNGGGAPEQAYRKLQSSGACPEKPFAGRFEKFRPLLGYSLSTMTFRSCVCAFPFTFILPPSRQERLSRGPFSDSFLYQSPVTTREFWREKYQCYKRFTRQPATHRATSAMHFSFYFASNGTTAEYFRICIREEEEKKEKSAPSCFFCVLFFFHLAAHGRNTALQQLAMGGWGYNSWNGSIQRNSYVQKVCLAAPTAFLIFLSTWP
jgi:hypothetical protein